MTNTELIILPQPWATLPGPCPKASVRLRRVIAAQAGQVREQTQAPGRHQLGGRGCSRAMDPPHLSFTATPGERPSKPSSEVLHDVSQQKKRKVTSLFLTHELSSWAVARGDQILGRASVGWSRSRRHGDAPAAGRGRVWPHCAPGASPLRAPGARLPLCAPRAGRAVPRPACAPSRLRAVSGAWPGPHTTGRP